MDFYLTPAAAREEEVAELSDAERLLWMPLTFGAEGQHRFFVYESQGAAVSLIVKVNTPCVYEAGLAAVGKLATRHHQANNEPMPRLHKRSLERQIIGEGLHLYERSTSVSLPLHSSEPFLRNSPGTNQVATTDTLTYFWYSSYDILVRRMP